MVQPGRNNFISHLDVPVIFVTPPSTAAAPTIAYSPGVMHVAIDLPHDDLNMGQSGLWLGKERKLKEKRSFWRQ